AAGAAEDEQLVLEQEILRDHGSDATRATQLRGHYSRVQQRKREIPHRRRQRRAEVRRRATLPNAASSARIGISRPTPYQGPNANAHAERFGRSMKEECLDRIIPIGERYFRRAVTEFVTHYHRERNHQGLENALIERAPATGTGRVQRQSRLGGLLNSYKRAA